MTQQHTPIQQLTALGYSVAAGAMRFDVAMSMGVSILARDDQGAVLQISCSKGALAITEVKQNLQLTAPAILLNRVIA
ncbi:hypothetical protein IIE18_10420 [Pseudomonas sp. V1]|uniref:hypothetical protein n=1 Tax=Pseudomonas arcuscaelestis TaxID=2710591 RepID=UPI0019401D71|nr:hypothetical protein [Pseudomonas arcuscaelestis]MBM3105553.1 hypothetical protein [Pseudomonas arcuscaelestis]